MTVRDPELIEAEPVQPVALSTRLWTAARVGAWVGGALGGVGFLIAIAFWLETVEASGSDSFVIIAGASNLILASALVSALFGAVVAILSRVTGRRRHPGMRLRSSRVATALEGGAIGFVLGAVIGALLAGVVGSPADGDENLVQLTIIGALAGSLVGGVLLGVITACATQIFAVPVVVEDGAEEEIQRNKARLVNAVAIPALAVLFLILLVVPLGWTLSETEPLGVAVAPIVAGLLACGILGFALFKGSRPSSRISFAEVGLAMAGILVVAGLVLAVMYPGEPGPPEVHGPGGTVTVEATPDFTFDESAWSVLEGEVTFVYEDEADLVHTLAIEGLEDMMELRVEGEGDEDMGTVNLAPGTYTLYCTIRGHRELGMEGQLTVEAAPGESAGSSEDGSPPPTQDESSG